MFFNKLFKRIKNLPHWRCLTCKNFCWWDGDYCCLDRNKILIDSPSGRITREQYDTLCRRYKHCWFYKEEYYKHNKNGLYIELDKLIKK